jgi:hypothetical protein
VYSTCLYCTKDLGANEILETLPIGRRVAFDARQGRLWVVCRSCEKWNLVPFDTRLETIDACERLFSETRVRFSTDNIGIARLKEGLELVRVGPAQRPEFAGWRYGDQFGRRRIRNAAAGGAVVVGAAAFIVGYHLLLPIVGGGIGLQNVFNLGYNLHLRRRVLLRIPAEKGVGGVVTRAQVLKASITRGTTSITRASRDSWTLWIPGYAASRGGFATGWRSQDFELSGPRAIDVLGKVMPRLNASGGSRRRVSDAVSLMEAGSPLDNPVRGRLKEMDKTVRLALEMAAHEDTERTALAGELKLLERQWQEAEEVAKIADSLAVSDDVDRQVGGEK